MRSSAFRLASSGFATISSAPSSSARIAAPVPGPACALTTTIGRGDSDMMYPIAPRPSSSGATDGPRRDGGGRGAWPGGGGGRRWGGERRGRGGICGRFGGGAGEAPERRKGGAHRAGAALRVGQHDKRKTPVINSDHLP